jgi:hypothetical protein
MRQHAGRGLAEQRNGQCLGTGTDLDAVAGIQSGTGKPVVAVTTGSLATDGVTPPAVVAKPAVPTPQPIRPIVEVKRVAQSGTTATDAVAVADEKPVRKRGKARTGNAADDIWDYRARPDLLQDHDGKLP